MNKEQELTTQLAQAIEDRARSRDTFTATIDELKKAIAAEKAPKLRDGDYGSAFRDDWVHLNGQTIWVGSKIPGNQRISQLPDAHFFKYSEVRNFKDMIADSDKYVTEFRLDGDNFAVRGNRLHLKWNIDDSPSGYFNIASLPALAMHFNQVYQTYKRKEANAVNKQA